MQRIFVQIASYRDPECLPTLRDLFAKARRPDLISVGLCWQDETPFMPDPDWADQVRLLAVVPGQSQGVCWARAQTQTLYQGEDFTLSIDSHMRFIADWDKQLIAEWLRCPSAKAVLSHHPAPYTPPDQCDLAMLPTVLHVDGFSPQGALRVRGRALLARPDRPLLNAFVAPGFLFAPGRLIEELPYDPLLYFGQEEMALAARLFTTGWDVYSPSKVLLYHYYGPPPGDHSRGRHWDDQPFWAALEERANQRIDHLLGFAESKDPAIIKDLDRYGLGAHRSLAAFEEFSGVDFRHRRVTEVARQGNFSIDSEKFLPPIAPRRSQARGDRRLGVDPSAPADVLLIRDFIDRPLCERLTTYAERQAYSELDVVDFEKTTEEIVATRKDEARVTQHVHIDGMAFEIISLFNDIYCNHVAPFFDANIEWYERPQILRYPVGGKYDLHADAEQWIAAQNQWVRLHDRDYSVLLYLNDGYAGGELHLEQQNFTIKPTPGLLLAFPSDHHFVHAARPTTSGLRYVMVSWAAAVGSARVRPQMPFGSVYLRQNRATS